MAQIKLGFAPTRRSIFSAPDAVKYRNLTAQRLREICLELIAQGAHNINLVNPTHFAHAVARALEEPLPVPVVWNSSGYERLETLRMLEGKVQVYLPDCKYAAPASAGRYSAAPDYPQTARAAILEMYRQTGPCVVEDGLLKRGVLIRHLILPGRLEEAKAVMDWIAASQAARRGALFPHGSVCALGQGGGISRDRPPPAPVRGAPCRGVHGSARPGGLCAGPGRGGSGIHPIL